MAIPDLKPLALILLLQMAALPATAQPLYRAAELMPPDKAVQLLERQGQLFVVAADRRQWRFEVTEAGPKFVPVADWREAELPANALPDGVVSHHRPSGLSAWLSGPTGRYDHGVLGDQIEAGGLRVRDRAGKVYDYRLGDQAVFEDRIVRLWDLDGDAFPELVVVRSGLQSGGQLAAFGLRRGAIREVAASTPIGRAYRWLNPVGAADFDGDGRIEVAAVITPHLGALLRLFRRSGDRLEPVYEAQGFSNHGIGMRSLKLAAVLDVNGDGISDIVAPNAARNAMRMVSFAGGTFSELGRLSHDASIAGDSVIFHHNGAPALGYPLSNGSIAVVEFPKGRLPVTKH